MKALFLSFFLFLSALSVSAADIYVNTSGQPGTYLTIQAAVTAATAGDRIFVSPYGFYNETVSINKSLTIASSVSGVKFFNDGSYTITGAPGQRVVIIGAVATGSMSGLTGTATVINRSVVYFVDCEASVIQTNQDGQEGNILFCKTSSSISIRYGKVIGCETLTNQIYVNDEPNIGIGDTIYVIGNRCWRLNWNNDDQYAYIANNYVNNTGTSGNSYAVRLQKMYYNSTNNNLFLNNTVLFKSVLCDYGGIWPTNGLNWSNLIVANNYVYYGNSGSSTCQNSLWPGVTTPTGSPPKCYYNIGAAQNGVAAQFWGASNNINYQFQTEQTIDDETGAVLSALAIDAGMPSIDNYDIDLTRNNIGTYGGPHSYENYFNQAAGSARVFHLDIPFEIWSGTTPSVKAEATHTK